MEDKNLELQLVSSEQAEELEYLGFPIKVLDIVDETHRNGVKLNVPEDCYVSENYYIRRCPSLELVAKWLREEKDFHINVRYLFMTSFLNNESKYTFYYGTTELGKILYAQNFNSYEKALSAGIDTAIEILKTK